MTDVIAPTRRPTLAVWKLASCDGCQLTLLDCEDELLALAEAVDLAWFPEAGPVRVEDRYDISLVEGSITTQADADRIQAIRAASRVLVAIGACATSGGIQALRNTARVRDHLDAVYANPHYIATLSTSTPVVHHVRVDHELRGCPIDKAQLLELLGALLAGRAPHLPTHPVCVECKQHGTTCVMVAEGLPCLGPVTQAGCGALCPACHRGCYGCFGPSEHADLDVLVPRLRELGLDDRDLVRALRTVNAGSEAFAAAARHVEGGAP